MTLRSAVFGLALTALAGMSWGEALSPFNPNRQVAVDSTPSNGYASLQSILNQIYGNGAVDAQADQSTVGMWRTSTSRFPTITPVLQFSYSSFGTGNSFGIFSASGDSRKTVALMKANANPGALAFMAWANPTTVSVFSTDCASVNCGTFTNINSNAFGFYLQGTGTASGTDGKFWTVDSLNAGGQAQALSFLHNPAGGAGSWTIAFNDTALSGSTGGNFNNLVVSIESITALPEPPSVTLTWTALAGLGCIVLSRKWSRGKVR